MPRFAWIALGLLAAFVGWQLYAREQARKAGLPVGPWIWNPLHILPRT